MSATEAPASGTGSGTRPPASGEQVLPFAMLGDPEAAACEGDACLIR